MATVNNAVVAIASGGVFVSGANVTLQCSVQTDTGHSFGMTVTAPISSTAGQLNNAILAALQQSVQTFNDTMPSNANMMVLGGRS